MTSQLDGELTKYREAMYDINTDKWLEGIKSEIDSMVRIKFGPSCTHLKVLSQLFANGFTNISLELAGRYLQG